MQCDECNFYEYDDEYEEYLCTVNMDEDEWNRFVSDTRTSCPYYQSNDEYKIVKKQM